MCKVFSYRSYLVRTVAATCSVAVEQDWELWKRFRQCLCLGVVFCFALLRLVGWFLHDR